MVQKQCLELLPNDNQCLQTLLDIYNEVSSFNEHIELRCILWKKGFGKGSPELPGLLLLEEIAINRILSIYSCNRDDRNFYEFANELLLRYCSACRMYNTIEGMQHKEDWDNVQFELINHYIKHLTKRKQLLSKVVGYLLPKLLDAKLENVTAVKIGASIIDLVEFSDGKELPIKLLRTLAKLKSPKLGTEVELGSALPAKVDPQS